MATFWVEYLHGGLRGGHTGIAGTLGGDSSARSHERTASARAQRICLPFRTGCLAATGSCRNGVRAATDVLGKRGECDGRIAGPVVICLCDSLPARIPARAAGVMA